MRFLVTGGAGFIGAALANRLAEGGHEVRVLDDLSAGDPSRLHADISLTRGDVNDIPKLWSLLQGVECVYHLAARVSVPESMLYPRDYNAVNVGGTVSVLEAMRDAGVRRVVFSSSGAVYGEQAVQPLRETMLPNPRSPYAVSKLAAENYVRVMGMRWGMESVSLRIFNAYGAHQQLPAAHPPVIPSFLRHALRGGSIVVHGNGTQTRDYVYIDDVVSALIAAATAPNVDRLVINVGSGIATSINDLIETIGEAIGKTLTPLYVGNQDAGVSQMQADLALAQEKLGFAPRTSLAEGLKNTLRIDPRFASK